MNFVNNFSSQIRSINTFNLVKKFFNNPANQTKIVIVAIAIISLLGIYLVRRCFCSHPLLVSAQDGGNAVLQPIQIGLLTTLDGKPNTGVGSPPIVATSSSPLQRSPGFIEARVRIQELVELFNSEEGFDIESHHENDPNAPATSASVAVPTGNMADLRARIESFKIEFGKYRRETSLSKVFDELDFMDQTVNKFGKILNNYHEVMSSYLESLKADRSGVVKQPDDGNCWAHAALFSLNDMDKALGMNHEQLRSDVVSWMQAYRAVDLNLAGCLSAAIEAHKHVKTAALQNDISEYQLMQVTGIISETDCQSGIERFNQQIEALQAFTIDQYFEYMRENGSHGSRAEFYAISNIFLVDVYIWRELPSGKLTKEFDKPIISVQNQGVMHVVLNARGNHFNSKAPDVR